MQISTLRWTPGSGWVGGKDLPDAQLLLVFGEHAHFHESGCFDELRKRFPEARIAGCSSSGNLIGSNITDGDVIATAVRFERTKVRLVGAQMQPGDDVAARARELALQLKASDLRHVLALCDGLNVNATQLAEGLNACGATVTGGLAGDADRFRATWVMADGPARQNQVVLIGLYGDIEARSTFCTGWTEFGAERIVTRSQGKVVYEIDGQPALGLYKKYLGDLASSLPASGMRFPLSITTKPSGHTLTRTLLAVDEAAQSLTFAGEVPQGSACRLMRTNFDHLIQTVDETSQAVVPTRSGPALCTVFTCLGRRIVLGQMVDEELEAAQRRLGDRVVMTGFYSYGELGPLGDVHVCDLHNQTMCMTTLQE
ncbi:MAG: FIST signal transduction protein [Planctomycetota bacterium]